MRRIVFLIAGLCTAAGVAAHAHHPYSTYDLEREITIAGEVASIRYAEPHSYLQIRASGASGGRSLSHSSQFGRSSSIVTSLVA